jgi:hypothetical protein
MVLPPLSEGSGGKEERRGEKRREEERRGEKRRG